ncbi:hypothetical protein EJD97_018555 [Solanum chilense]|uniref:Uncharacterized protein n=1 Tax=Solanum chilense TaxID=4083 RepID=A0A6N2C9V0_SOLCI|nr:hypothetical protein EJD97_018555 [Solanum chilense]
MNTTRTPSRRVNRNDVHEEINPQLEQVHQFLKVLKVHKMIKSLLWKEVMMFLFVPPELSNSNIREILLTLARAVTTQANLRHKVRDCPTIASRRRDGKQVSLNVPNDDAPNKRRSFYALQTKGSKQDEDEK